MEKIKVPTKYGDYTIRIMQDTDPEDPQNGWEPATQMVCKHRRYNLGNDNLRTVAKQATSMAELRDTLINEHQAVCLMPLRLYDHSGISISCSIDSYPYNDQWDSMYVGFAFLAKAEVEANGWTNDVVRQQERIKADVRIYDDYLQGNVYGFEVIAPDGEQLDGCWGFYGDHKESGLLDEAHACINNDVTRKDKGVRMQIEHHCAHLKRLIRAHVPLIYRKPLVIHI